MRVTNNGNKEKSRSQRFIYMTFHISTNKSIRQG